MKTRTIAALFVAVALVAAGSVGAARWYRRVARARAEARCAASVEELRAYLRLLAHEEEVTAVFAPAPGDRIVERKYPDVKLVPVEADPKSLPFLAVLSLRASTLAFADTSSLVTDETKMAAVFRSVDESHLSPAFGFGGVGYWYETHPFVLFVDEASPWGEVVTVADAAARAGYAQIVFAFDAKSAVSAPPDSPPLRRMLAIAADKEEMPWKRDVKAAQLLRQESAKCPDVAAAFAADARSSTEMNAQREAFVTGAPEAVRACACDVDLGEVKAFAWVRFGRHWGPTTVSYVVEVAPGDRTRDTSGRGAVPLAAPAGIPWRDAHARVIDAAEAKTRVFFVAEP